MTGGYHVGLSADQLAGARIALLPGDPARVPAIAAALSDEAAELASRREFRTYLARCAEGPALVTSTGIGGPSTAIAVEELARLGVEEFVRVGTTGAIQEGVAAGDVVITTGAVRLDGASRHYAPVEYPAVSDFGITRSLVAAATRLRVRFHVGVTASSDTFYPGQERYDTHSGYVLRSLQGSLAEWRQLHVLNFEMEAATLFVVAGALGLRAGCVTGVVVNRTASERVEESSVRIAESNAIAVAAAAARARLAGRERLD